MDPLTISASIGALLTIAVKLMSAGYSYGSSVKDFPQELQDLMAELQSLSAILTTLSVIYGQAPPGTVVGSQSAIDPFGGALVGCERCLKSAFENLEKHNSGNRLRKIFKRITWPMTESETKELFQRLGRYKSTFALATSAYDTTLRRATYDGIEELKNHEIEKSAKKESEKKSRRFRQIIRWLSSADPEINHMAAREIRQDGTGKWFTEGQTYRDWLSADSSFLWLHGKPGAGKTILSAKFGESRSIVIDHVKSEISPNAHPNGTPVLIYFYCDFKDTSKQTADSLVGSLIAQLIREKSEVPDELEKLYQDKFDEGVKPPNATHLEGFLLSILKEFPKVVVIIDALDECMIEKRDRLCKRLKKLIGHAKTNILVISRDEPDIREEFSNLPVILITDEDVSVDIELYVRGEIGRQGRLNKLKPSTKSSIVSTLVSEANGMFRWASCCLDEIIKLRTDKAIKAALKSLPPTLEQSYERILCNIDERDKTLAIRVFQWLLFSHRPMVLWEIVDAIAVEAGDTYMDPEAKLNDPEDILNICGGLVKMDQRNMTLGLAHFTVKEYLISTSITRGPAAGYQICLPIANAELIRTCLTYILFDDFSSGHSKTEGEYNARIQEYPLLLYAVCDWPGHFFNYQAGSDETLDELILSFFCLDSNCGKFLTWLQVYLAGKGSDISYFTDRGRSGLPTPIHIAADMGYIPAVDYLLGRGVDINIACGYGDTWYGTPLIIAIKNRNKIKNGNVETARFLLEKGADPNRYSAKDYPPLVHAVKVDSVECAQLLLSYDAESPSDGNRYGDAINSALYFGREAMIGLLLETDECKDLVSADNAKLDLESFFFLTFVLSVSRGMESLFRRFWDTDWGVDMVVDRGLFPGVLQTAIYRGHIKYIRIIIQDDKARAVFMKDEIFCMVLRESAYAGNQAIVELLLDLRKDIPTSDMGVALSLAAANGHTHMIEYLIRAGADPLYKDTEGWSPLLYASEYQKKSAVEVLSAIENVSESLKLAEMVGPKSWQTTHERPGIEVSADGLEARHVNTESLITIEAGGSITPLSLGGNYSFEVNVLKASEPGSYLAVGFADALYFRQSIWKPKRPEVCLIFETEEARGAYIPQYSGFYNGMTWGYCSSGVISHGEDFTGAPNYGAHDTIGCHFNSKENIAFFTLNGEVAGKCISMVIGRLVPIVTLGPGAHIRANFGDPTHAVPGLSTEMVEDAWVATRDPAWGAVGNFECLV